VGTSGGVAEPSDGSCVEPVREPAARAGGIDCGAAGFDSGSQLCRRDFAAAASPAILLTRAIWWAIVLVGFLVGVSALDTALTSELALRIFAYLPNVLAALVVLVAGSIIARFLSRSVLIGAVNMNLQYARLLSAGVKWLVIVLTVAMALEHLSIGGDIIRLAFGILFGGIVFALALAVGLGSKELVSRSLEREASRMPTRDAEESFRHL
jgi:hypothetical protein